jgi:hypothetical protein
MISYEQLIEQLQGFCDQSQTGTMLISADNGSAGKIGIINGKVIGITFANRNGQQALEVVKGCKSVDVSFWKGKSIVAVDPDLPATTEILKILRGPPSNHTPVNSTRPGARDVKQSSLDIEQFAPTLYTSDLVLPGTDALKRLLQVELTRSIGPVASVYIERYQTRIDSIRNKEQFIQLLQLLAGKTANLETAAEFFERVINNMRAS